MASIFERLDNREAFKVEIKGGSIWLREPTFADSERVAAMPKAELTNGMALALCLVNEDGSRAYTATDGESDEAFASRVLTDCKQYLGRSQMKTIMAGMMKLIEPPDQDELAKN